MNNLWKDKTISWFPFFDLSLKTYKEFFMSNFGRYLHQNCRPEIQCLLRNTMSWIQKIVKHVFHYNGNCLFEKLINCFWKHTISKFAHFSSKCIYIIMVFKCRINVQILFNILKFIVIYIILTTYM